jgi:FtsH-binding integral membrane protein
MQRNVVLGIVAAAVGVALVPSLPYGYYTVMRWVVCALCIWLSISAHRAGQEPWTWAWAIVAGIYNPVFPVHANREVWSIVNLATIVVAVGFGLSARPTTETSS